MKKRILIVNKLLKIGGGGSRIASEIASRLKRRGYEVTFLSFYSSELKYDMDGEIITFDENRRPSFPLEYTGRNLKRGKKIANICRKRDIDTLISFGFAGNYSTLLSRVLFNNKSRILISVRTNTLAVNNNRLSMLVKKWLYPKADLVISLSKGIEDILNSELDIKTTTTIYNPQPLDKFQSMGKKSINKEHKELFSQEEFTFINVGRLAKQKGQWHLLRSFKKVLLKNENSKLIILGEGEFRDKLENLARKLGIEDKVFMLGVVENVFPYLKRGDCFVFTSLYEGFGNAQIEALSQNLPVISADCVAGPRDILCPELDMGKELDYPYNGEHGILSKPFNQKINFESLEEKSLTEEEETLAQAMIKIMEDEELRERYSNGVERVRDFEPDNIMDQWEKVI